jgi:hypothetical protein
MKEASMSPERDHSADSEQPFENGFAEGQAEDTDPEEWHVGSFAEGQEELDDDEGHKGRFSEGQEELGEDDPEKHYEGSFGEGQEDE